MTELAWELVMYVALITFINFFYAMKLLIQSLPSGKDMDGSYRSQNSLLQYWSVIPPSFKILFAFVAVSSLLNFVYTFFIINNGYYPAIINGSYVLKYKDAFIPLHSKEEYIQRLSYHVRGISGLFVLFSSLSFMYCRVLKAK